jgi:hypothetical protein
MVKDTYSSELKPFLLRICMRNNSNAMRAAIIDSTHLKCHRDLIHVLDSLIFTVMFIRMDHLVLVIYFKFEIPLLKRFEVVEEGVQRITERLFLQRYLSRLEQFLVF